MTLRETLRARARRMRRTARLRAVAAWRMSPDADLIARVWFGRARRVADRRPLLAPLTAISEQARREAKLQADQCITDGFVLRNNPVWRPAPPIYWGSNPRNDGNWHYRINTFEPVEPLLYAYRCGAGERYFSIARAVAVDWIDHNLLRDVPNKKKWHDMATALRARVFGQILDTELRRPHPKPAVVARLAWALAQHAHFLADPKQQPWGNHALFVMYGLAHLLWALPELREAAAYRRYCLTRMKELMVSQFSPDGFHLEHSPEYHLYLTETVADLVDSQLCTELEELPDIVRRGRAHYHELFHPNGDLVMLGDSERRASDRHGSNPERTLCRLANHSDSQSGQVRAYPHSGYAVFRSHFGADASSSDDYFLLGAGHHSRVHKHSDHLGFEWSFRGVPILIDSGKGTYTVKSWMRYFRSTRAGNAVEVDEKNYVKTPHEGKSHIVAWGDADGVAYVVARHHAHRFDLTQTRALIALPGQYLLVIDRLVSTEEHAYRQWFHLHEALNLEHGADGLRIADADQRCWLTAQDLTGQASLELAKGQMTPRKQGFVSPEYGARIVRHSLAFCRRAAATDFVTLFAGNPARSPHVLTDGALLDVRWLDAEGRTHGVRFSPESTTPIERVRG